MRLKAGDWRHCLPAQEEARYDPPAVLGFGRRPAVVAVDVTEGYRAELYDLVGQQDRGQAFSDRCLALLESARRYGVPLIFVAGKPEPARDSSLRWKHVGPIHSLGDDQWELWPELNHDPETELLLRKTAPSAFFGTDLAGCLVALGVDTVVIAGFVTSGCVFATAVDAFSLRFRVVIPEASVDDRSALAHNVALFNIHRKYGDVRVDRSVHDYFRSTREEGARASA